MYNLSGFKKVVVTGGAGTCGDRIVSELLAMPAVERVISLDNDEGKLFFQREKLKSYSTYRSSLVDIRSEVALTRTFKGADLVIHCAAYKNVPMCEISPTSCVDVNIKGTENVIEAAITAGVKKVLFTSSDKAVNPTNIMGATKLVGERLIVAANLLDSDTIFAATRFGNVLGSTGSVLLIFVSQILKKEPMTVTDPAMTRFMMSQKQSAKLVIESAERALGGEIFITKMPVLEVGAFAEALYSICVGQSLIQEPFDSNRNLKIIGARAGEKHYEELMSLEEQPRSKDAEDFFVVMPNAQEVYADINAKAVYESCEAPDRTYNSNEECVLSLTESEDFLRSVIDDDNIELSSI